MRKTRRDGQAMLVPNPTFAERGWRTYVWNNVPGWGAEDLAYRLANGGYKVVLCPVTNLYFDLAWNPNPEERGLDWGGYVDLRKPFEFVPFDYYRNVRDDRRGQPARPAALRRARSGSPTTAGPTSSASRATSGPRRWAATDGSTTCCCRSSSAWRSGPGRRIRPGRESPTPAKAEALYREAWSEFVNVLGKRELPRLDREGIRVPHPHARPEGGGRHVRASLRAPGLHAALHDRRQRAHGDEPRRRGPIPARGTVRVAAFDSRGRKGHTATISAP